MSFITSADVKTFLEIPTATTAEDSFIQILTSAAIDVVQQYTGHTFSSADTSAYYDGTGLSFLYVKAPIISITTLTKAATRKTIADADPLVVLDDYVYYPSTGRIELTSGAFVSGAQNIYIEYVYGYAAVPQAIKNATIEIAVKAFRDHRNGRFGVNSKELNSRSDIRQTFIRDYFAPSTKMVLDLYHNPLDETIEFTL